MEKFTEKQNETFNKLYQLDVNGHTEKKNNLTYLSWAWAWAEVKKLYPDATYEIWKDENHRPYVFDTNLGYMCFTTVTIENQSHEMWLPVMDGANKAQKSVPYTYPVKDMEYKQGRYSQKKDAEGNLLFATKTVESATMFDINTAIMRCLVKNLAMFGLGLYIYAGEDIPQCLEEEPKVELKKGTAKKETSKKETVKKESPKSEAESLDITISTHIAGFNNCKSQAELVSYWKSNISGVMWNEVLLSENEEIKAACKKKKDMFA